MRLTRIRIQNYRSFNDTGEQNLTKLFALIGKNNSGKSAFIDAIQCVWGNKKLTSEDCHKKNGKPIEIKIVVESVDGTAGRKETEIVVKHEDEKTNYVINGKIGAKPPSNLPELLIIPAIRNPESESTAGKGSFLINLISSIINLKVAQIKPLATFHDKPAKDLEIDEIKALLESKTSTQLKDLSQIASGYLQESLGDSALGIVIDPDSDLSKAVKFSTKIRDPYLGKELEKVNVLNCGTGLQSMAIIALLQTYADLQKQENSILLIEEPEVYLHPELQRKMFAVLRRIAKRTQVIYTTHSPIMISDLWDDSVRLITRKNGETEIAEVDIGNVIKELGIRYEDVLNPRVVVFVEGMTDVLFFKRLVELKHPEVYENIDRNVKFVATGGFQTIHIYALMNILLSANVTVPFYIIADSDGESRADRISSIFKDIEKRIKKYDFVIDKSKFKNLPTNIYPLSQYAIESYFLDYEFLKLLDKSLTTSECEYFIDHYQKTYKKILNEGNKELLKQTMKPKLLFSNPNTENQLNRMKKAFSADAKFFEIRERFLKKWEAEMKRGQHPIGAIVNDKTINNPGLKEPCEVMGKILKECGLLK